jgi:nicotinate-nucleotide pyrophosphorylase (carboxylating)
VPDAYDAFARDAVARALREDVGPGDVTSTACIPAGAQATAEIVAKAPGVVCGLDVAARVFAQVDAALLWRAQAHEGDRVEPGQVVARLQGATRSILEGERVALNFLQRLSGVATLTRAFVDALSGTGCRVLDTRKTTPGLRLFERAAVRAGGGVNHRAGLHDMILIKDNHVAAAGGAVEAVTRALATRAFRPGLLVEVEATTLAQVEQLATLDVDRILLDNMGEADVARAVAMVDAAGAQARTSPRRTGTARRWPELEASGGITLANARALALTGVDYVSVGALTHSAPALDLSLELVPAPPAETP